MDAYEPILLDLMQAERRLRLIRRLREALEVKRQDEDHTPDGRYRS